MRSVSRLVARFREDDGGVSSIEYGLIAALIALVIITSVTAIASSLNATMETVAAKIAAAT